MGQEGATTVPLRLERPLSFPLWMIPAAYVAASVAAGVVIPRLEQAWLPTLGHPMSAQAALAAFATVASGSMAFTGMVFAVAFIAVQFSAVAYSPRLVVMFANAPRLYHTLGLFFATFTYCVAALMWTDRRGSGVAPLISSCIVGLLLLASMLAFARLIQAIQALQMQNVLQRIGARGRAVIGDLFPPLRDGDRDAIDAAVLLASLPPARGAFTYAGSPLVIAELDLRSLTDLARTAGAVIVVEQAVGDTLIDGVVLCRVHGGERPIDGTALGRTFRLAAARTFEQDPKYAIRLLVDVAIRALSPAINDPTTAVQALDQIEDLLGRLGRSELDSGYTRDETSALRVFFPAPTWDDYLSLAFDEIRQYGATSLQVTRRLRAALSALPASITHEGRRMAVQRYLEHLDRGMQRSTFDDEDRVTGMSIDRQGLGLARPFGLH